ncbi:MAG TPA: phosphotransferase family protein [Stellaceae bacterium]|nr:phosphotransferase family protein [Stellaceae bacterium]
MSPIENSLFRPAVAEIPQDWPALARHLAGRRLTLGPAPPRQFAGGFGNLNYLLEIDGAAAVLRRPPAGPVPRGANDMEREHRILSRLWRAYPLAPRAIHYCADAAVLGAPFQIVEYRPGIVIRDVLPPAAGGAGDRLSRNLVDCLVQLHAIAPAAVGLETLGRPQGFLARTLAGWSARGAALEDLVEPRPWAETLAWLGGRLPAAGPTSLVHNDFKLDNVILDPASFAPVAVIDWDMGTQGDPLWDLAVLLSYWVEPGDPLFLHEMRQMPTAAPGFWSRRQVFDAYCRLSGRAVGDFSFYRVLALLRSGIVFLQLYDRYRRDPAHNAPCARFSGLGRNLLRYAYEVRLGRAA